MTKIQKGFVCSCLLLTFISEMLLSPFYPQLFSNYFHVDGVQATSMFIICCRLTVIIMVPFWARVIEKWGLQNVITGTLALMAGCKLLIPMADTFYQFLAVSIVLLFFQSSVYLLYPAMAAASKDGEERVKATTGYLVVFNGSVIISGIVGSFVVSRPFPLDSYYLFALMDLALVAASCLVLPKAAATGEKGSRSAGTLKGGKWQAGFLAYLLIVFLFYAGHHTIRPYLTVYLEDTFAISEQGSSLLYVMPSIAAIVLHFILPKRYLHSHVMLILIGLMVGTGVLLFFHTAVEQFWLFVLIRILYGICFFVSLAAVDLLFFKMKIGKTSPLLYSVVTSVQNMALLFSPAIALMMVHINGIGGPFLLSGFLLMGSALGTALLLLNRNKGSFNKMKRGVGYSENL